MATVHRGAHHIKHALAALAAGTQAKTDCEMSARQMSFTYSGRPVADLKKSIKDLNLDNFTKIHLCPQLVRVALWCCGCGCATDMRGCGGGGGCAVAGVVVVLY